MIVANPKAELNLIATCLCWGQEATRMAAAEIGEEDFHELQHRSAWQVLAGLLVAGQKVDLVHFDTFWPKVVGPNIPLPSELFEAIDQRAGSLDEIPRQVAEVKEWTRRRQIHAQALKLAAAASNPKSDVEAALSECQTVCKAKAPGMDRTVGPEAAVNVLVEDLEARQALDGALSGMATGFSRVDEATDGLQKTELSIIGARPNAGKSALLLGIANHVAFQLHRPVLFVTLEMSVSMLLRRLAALQARVGLGVMKRGKMTQDDFVRLTSFSARLKKAPIWFYNGVGCMNTIRMKNVVRCFVEDHGIQLVIVDYLQKLPACGKHEKRTYEVAESSGTLKALAMDHNIHVCSAAQLSRSPEKEKNRMPLMSDLADSSQIERDADLIALLHRDPKADEGTLIVAKQRDGEFAIQHLWFDKQHCRFSEEQ